MTNITDPELKARLDEKVKDRVTIYTTQETRDQLMDLISEQITVYVGTDSKGNERKFYDEPSLGKVVREAIHLSHTLKFGNDGEDNS